MKTYDNLQKEISGNLLDEGVGRSVAKIGAMRLKKYHQKLHNEVEGLGSQIVSEKDIGKKLEIIAKQNILISQQEKINAGMIMLAVSVSDEKGILSKSLIFQGLSSSYEPDADLDFLTDEVSVN